MIAHTLITAHSGCEGAPEDSIGSIEKGIAAGADCVEIDVRAGEGKLFLSHDAPRRCGGYVSLEEAFVPIGESAVMVNCDLKEYGALLPALETADRCGIRADRLAFSGSVDTGLLADMPDIAKRCLIFLNSEELVKDLTGRSDLSRGAQAAFLLKNFRAAADRLRALGAAALNAPYLYMPEELLEKLREENVPLSLWTLNDDEALREYMGKGLFNITTRIPIAALAIRGEREK